MHTRVLTALVMAILAARSSVAGFNQNQLMELFTDARAIVRMAQENIQDEGNFLGDPKPKIKRRKKSK